MLITSSLQVDILILFSFAFYLFYKYMTRKFNYWKNKNVFYIKPVPFFGNFLDLFLFRTTSGELLANMYNQTKEPFFGVFMFDKPILMVRSPELVKQILVRDFQNFDDRNVGAPAHDELISNMLFFNKNPEWKAIRTKMSPVFTSGKLKGMIPLINDSGEDIKKYLNEKTHLSSIEAKEVCAKFTTDVIARCAFGINANSFKDENAEFRNIGRIIFDFTVSNALNQTIYMFAPGLVNFFRLNFLDPRVKSFLQDAFWQTIKLRQESNKKVNDLIDIIIQIKENNADFEGEKMLAQAVQFFLAGFETNSSTMGFTLYELSIHPEIQKRLRTEIRQCLDAYGEFTYEAINSMKYLSMCIKETLRKYPVLAFLDRLCKNDYKIPGSNFVLEKGTPVFIPMFGLHYDNEYFPNPETYDPERFSEANIEKIPPYSYIPFGEGPRNCIGERFGLLSTKLGLVHILSEFEVERSDDTPVPMIFEPKCIVLASKVGLPMRFKKSKA